MGRNKQYVNFLLVCICLAGSTSAHATSDGFHLGKGVSEYRRFIAYPHLQKAFSALKAGKRDLALREFGRTREILPDNPAAAVYLANALSHFGEPDRARKVLEEQLSVTPADAGVLAALSDLETPKAADALVATAAPAAECVPACPQPVLPVTGEARRNAALRLAKASTAASQGAAALAATLAGPAPVFSVAADEKQWIVLLDRASVGERDLVSTYVPRHASNRLYHAAAALPRLLARNETGAVQHLLGTLPASAFRGERFELALRQHRVDDALTQARAMLAANASSATTDTLSYRLMDAGAKTQAAALLLETYPYPGTDETTRLALLRRLALLAGDIPAAFATADRERLATPLATPALRSAQAAVFSALSDCDSVRALLGDGSPAYARDDWMRLGDCYRSSAPALAQHAYGEARTRSGNDTTATRTFAYQAYANADYASALDAWQSLPPEGLSSADMMAAATTALAAGDNAAAGAWLDRYAAAGGAQDDTYWWRRAQALAKDQPVAASDALAHAIQLNARADHYLLLAQLQSRRYLDAAAVGSLEKALALDPQNITTRLQLAYAYAAVERPADARRQLEAAHAARPDDTVPVQQLVYVSQQQGDSESARLYAAQVIDALPAANAGSSDAADKLYGFRRLHEDLGRRWTLSADIWSGGGLTTAANTVAPGTSYRSYSQIEAEYRLDANALPARLLAPYVRIFAGSGTHDSALPAYAPMLGAGLRLRPWQSQNVVFAAEKQTPLDDSPGLHEDTMLRASASLLDGGRFSNEWHPVGEGWTAQSLYLDLAHFLSNRQDIATADYRAGYHRKQSSQGRTLEPYLHLQYTLVDGALRQQDYRAGAGLAWNLWFGETRYDAWPHKVTVGLELQHAFHTWLSDTNTLALSAGIRW